MLIKFSAVTITFKMIPIFRDISSQEVVCCHFSNIKKFVIPNDVSNFLIPDELNCQSDYFLKKRLLTRFMLSKYFSCSPLDIVFDYSRNKPGIFGRDSCDFNISHSDDSIAIICCKSGSCGVDIEKNRKIKFRNKIADRFMIKDDGDNFIEQWTRKEAVIKCLGKGMFQDAKNYDVYHDIALYKGEVTNIRINTILSGGFYLSVAHNGLECAPAIFNYDFNNNFLKKIVE
jgi:phosphopantetheinyl transferase